jgi:hypothetical protein
MVPLLRRAVLYAADIVYHLVSGESFSDCTFYEVTEEQGTSYVLPFLLLPVTSVSRSLLRDRWTWSSILPMV